MASTKSITLFIFASRLGYHLNLKKGEVLLSFENEITDKKLTEIYERIRKENKRIYRRS